MQSSDLMNKIRYWDSLMARWIMRHFYLTFFQIVLAVVFILWFINLFNVIDFSVQVAKDDLFNRMILSQSVNMSIIVFLILLNSFWMLFIFNGIQRLRTILKDISYHTSRFTRKNL